MYARMLRGFAATTRYMTQTLFSSFRRKRESGPRRAGSAPVGSPVGGRAVGSAETRSTGGGREAEKLSLPGKHPGAEGEVFSSFWRKGVSAPAPDPDFEKLSPEALIAMAERLLGGGLFSSF